MKNLFACSGKLLTVLLLLFYVNSYGQQRSDDIEFNPLSYGLVLDNPAMKNVKVEKDISYFKDDKSNLHVDIYSSSQLKSGDKRPAIIFLNAIGDRNGEAKVKTWGIYSTWPKLMASYGYVGISMETDGSRIQESIGALFNFLDKHGDKHHIDKDKLGVYAASANVTQSFNYMMSDKVYQGIKAAVLYYGSPQAGPFRKDLPVLFVVAEGDAARNGYGNLWNEVLKNNAPWTICMETNMPHAFDAFADNDASRKIVKQTISFWKDNLDPVQQPSFSHSKLRDVLGLLRLDQPKALATLKTVVKDHPDNVRLLSFYADVLRESGKPEEAELVYRKILEKQPGDKQSLISMAVIAYSKNNPDEAEKYVLAVGKMTADEYSTLGFRLLVAGRDKEAAKYYEMAVTLKPNGRDFYNLCCAYAKYGEKDRAFAALEKAIELRYPSKELLETDTDLVSIRSDQRFKELVKKVI
jgi:Tfp pilus assembly protein PilF